MFNVHVVEKWWDRVVAAARATQPNACTRKVLGSHHGAAYLVMRASPVGQRTLGRTSGTVRHSSSSSGPAARWIAVPPCRGCVEGQGDEVYGEGQGDEALLTVQRVWLVGHRQQAHAACWMWATGYWRCEFTR